QSVRLRRRFGEPPRVGGSGTEPAPDRPGGSVEPGAYGPERHGVHGPSSTLPAVPTTAGLRRRGRRRYASGADPRTEVRRDQPLLPRAHARRAPGFGGGPAPEPRPGGPRAAEPGSGRTPS